MNKTYTREEVRETEKMFKGLTKLTDRSSDKDYGTLSHPITVNGYTFSHFEIDPEYKKPKYIRTFIKLISSGSTHIERFKKNVTNYKPDHFTKKLIINSVFKNKNGDVLVIPQSNSSRIRSYIELYTITKYFYPSLTLEKFFNYCFKTIRVYPYYSFPLLSAITYTCSTIGRPVMVNQNLDLIESSILNHRRSNTKKIGVVNGELVATNNNSKYFNSKDIINNNKKNLEKAVSIAFDRPFDECSEILSSYISRRLWVFKTDHRYCEYVKFVKDDGVFYLDSPYFKDKM